MVCVAVIVISQKESKEDAKWKMNPELKSMIRMTVCVDINTKMGMEMDISVNTTRCAVPTSAARSRASLSRRRGTPLQGR